MQEKPEGVVAERGVGGKRGRESERTEKRQRSERTRGESGTRLDAWGREKQLQRLRERERAECPPRKRRQTEQAD